MKILIACEFSGTVRDAFIARGHDAMSCDLLPTEKPGPHHQGDVLAILDQGWDMMIGHPECTFLALCQVWRKHPSRADAQKYGLAINDTEWRPKQRAAALEFFRALWNAPIPRICLENPMSIASRIEKKSQTIHPWQFGHGEKKETWLWLKNLPQLRPTNIVAGREERIWKMPPGENRKRERSRTFQGIADAMANQWSNL